MVTVTRRALLGAATAAGATALVGPFVARASRTASVSRDAWIAFAKTVKGPVYLPGTWQFDETKLLFDTRYDSRQPAAVMQVASQSDVRLAMVFAAGHGLRVAPRSGGHSYTGASAANGTFVLDTRHYDAIHYDSADQTVKVWSGAGLYAVHEALAAHGRTIPTGTCPTVGASGLTLGGGLGVESRRWGLTCDRLVSATFVLPDGRGVTGTSSQNRDLFWAARGGGGGNIAFLTSMTFATHAATPKGIFTLSFPASSAAKVIAGWNKWSRTTSTSRWANLHVDSLGNGGISISTVGVAEAGDEHSAAAALVHAVGVAPTRTRYLRLSYLDAVRYLGGGTTSPRQGFVAGSDIIKRPLYDTKAPAAIVAAVVDRSRAGGIGAAIIDPLDGRVNQPAAGATAFPWRDHAASVQWYAGVSAARLYSSTEEWVAQAHQRVRAYSSGGYVNYLETGQLPSRYYAGNLARLSQIRQLHDPHKLLYSGLNI